MRCIYSHSTDPYFNIAAEAYLFNQKEYDYFFLYTNNPSIIVGKHQNALAEINYRVVREHNIKVVRRLSGGGAVYHDTGNLNFCFILNGEKNRLIDFQKYASPILLFINSLGVNAYFGHRDNMFVDKRKFSGNAEHIVKQRVLHHGTLLFDTNLEMLVNSTTATHNKYSDKAIQSVRSKVLNIKELITTKMSYPIFVDSLFEHINNSFEEAIKYNFTNIDLAQIDDLISHKFGTWEWNFGYSPKYILEKNILISDENMSVTLSVQKGGTIEWAKIESQLLGTDIAQNISSNLRNCLHREQEISEILATYNITNKEFIYAFF